MTPKRLTPSTPWAVFLLGAIALAWIIGPVLALGVRVPWGRIGEIAAAPETRELTAITLSAAIQATVITLLLGIPLALWLQHVQRGRNLVRLLVLLPLAMPPVVGGLALTALVGRRGLLAPVLDALGFHLAFEFAGVVASHVFVALPFVVVTLDSALRQIDAEVPASAAGIGLSPGEILRKITLPTIAPSIGTAAGLAFARSLGEFGTTLTFAGSMPGVTRTMPLGIYLMRETDPDAAYALSALLIVLAVASLVLAQLPTWFRRTPKPTARTIGPVDVERLRELTRPETSGTSVTINDTVIPADRITAIIGANGSGKTTLVSMIAGRLTGATVALGDRVVDAPDQRPVPAHERGVVLLTQRPGLPRTTTVAGAITMVTRDKQRTQELLDAAGLDTLADVPVPALSGGQAAQVALVRALSAKPAVLIADEPLAAVDAASSRGWRQVLRATVGDRTTLMITHDPLDIAGLSEHVVVIEEGSVISSQPTEAELTVPSNNFVAGLAGLNRLTGTISGVSSDMMTINSNGTIIDGVASEDVSSTRALTEGTPAVVTIAPEATTLRLPRHGSHAADVKESARNVWPGTVASIDNTPGAAHVTVTVEIGAGTITVPVTRESALELELERGATVECVTKALNVSVHPHRDN
ncbi:ATP-binding cassette domain-containing protein [Corynebacterium pilosum]|uniref:Molybdate transport system permease n=1 Tax=Corynebacterium pilosum TaxID=35756 RepID=A0A376CRE4_9CORY|nr:ATP-binding cassette domain-containing protein [Corynebacterium pilosum]STC70208.1 molybdate transport system permease [Corynebacterium pilosum]